MATIVPAILTNEDAKFNAEMQAYQGFTRRIQVDFSDGTFASNSTVPLDMMQFPVEMNIDLHMITAKPSQYLQKVISLKPALCIMHAESDDNIISIAQQLRGAGIKIGIALLPGTFPRKAQELIANADHVLIFAGKLGEQSGGIDMLQIEKVPLIKALNANAEIGWDGGANLGNVRALAHAGIDIINVGGALSQSPDPAAMYQSLVAETEKKGVLI